MWTVVCLADGSGDRPCQEGAEGRRRGGVRRGQHGHLRGGHRPPGRLPGAGQGRGRAHSQVRAVSFFKDVDGINPCIDSRNI